MINDKRNDQCWVTLQEASDVTGRSVTAIRMLIKRKKIDQARKIKHNGRNSWLIHEDTLKHLKENDLYPDQTSDRCDQSHRSKEASIDHSNRSIAYDHLITIPVEYYEQQQKERDQLMQCMMMYRYKFEELDRKMKLLPGPVEIIVEEVKNKEIKLREKEEALQAEIDYREQLSSVLQKKEQALESAQKIIQEALERNKKHEEALALQKEEWGRAMEEAKKPLWKKLMISLGLLK